MQAMDEMWHAFVLHTKDYAEFCDRYLGRFVHHLPETAETTGMAPVSDADVERLITLVYTRLGKATADLWFDRFAKRYTPEFLEDCRREAASRALRRGARESRAARRG
jgi:hypothetical protein